MGLKIPWLTLVVVLASVGIVCLFVPPDQANAAVAFARANVLRDNALCKRVLAQELAVAGDSYLVRMTGQRHAHCCLYRFGLHYSWTGYSSRRRKAGLLQNTMQSCASTVRTALYVGLSGVYTFLARRASLLAFAYALPILRFARLSILQVAWHLPIGAAAVAICDGTRLLTALPVLRIACTLSSLFKRLLRSDLSC